MPIEDPLAIPSSAPDDRIDTLETALAKPFHGDEDLKTCPYCCELIKFYAIKCKHCGERLDKVEGEDTSRSKGSDGVRDGGKIDDIVEGVSHPSRRGEVVVVLATCIALASLLFNWVEAGIIGSSGFVQGGYWLLGFYIYPAGAVVLNRSMSRPLGVICSILACSGVCLFISFNSFLLEHGVRYVGRGLYLFIVASALLAFGSWLCPSRRKH